MFRPDQLHHSPDGELLPHPQQLPPPGAGRSDLLIGELARLLPGRGPRIAAKALAQQLFDIVKEGVEKHAPPGYESDMPAFGDTLSDGEIRAVLAFIHSTWPDDVKRRYAAIEARNR